MNGPLFFELRRQSETGAFMTNLTPQITLMNPILTITDLDRAVNFYCEMLGFEVTWKYGDPPLRAGVARDGFEMQLAGGPSDFGPCMVYFLVTDVDGYYRECVQRGAKIETEIGDRPFQVRDFRILDPDGNKVGFGQPLTA